MHEPALALPTQLQFAPLVSCVEHAGSSVAFHVQLNSASITTSLMNQILEQHAAKRTDKVDVRELNSK